MNAREHVSTELAVMKCMLDDPDTEELIKFLTFEMVILKDKDTFRYKLTKAVVEELEVDATREEDSF